MSWVGHKGTRKAYRILVRRSEWKRPLGSLHFHNIQRHNNAYTYTYTWSDHILGHLYALATCLYPDVQEWELQDGQQGWIWRQQNLLSFLKYGLVFLTLYIVFIPFNLYSDVHSHTVYATSCPSIRIILTPISKMQSNTTFNICIAKRFSTYLLETQILKVVFDCILLILVILSTQRGCLTWKLWIILVFPILDSAIVHFGSPMRAVFLSG
jgi:hypothetical protein